MLTVYVHVHLPMSSTKFLSLVTRNAIRVDEVPFLFYRSLLRNLTSYVHSDVFYRLLLPSSINVKTFITCVAKIQHAS